MRKLFLVEAKVRVLLSLAAAFFLVTVIAIPYEEYKLNDQIKSLEDKRSMEDSVESAIQNFRIERIKELESSRRAGNETLALELKTLNDTIKEFENRRGAVDKTRRAEDEMLARLQLATWNDGIKEDLPKIVAIIIATAVGLFILLTTCRMFLTETHVGWRRISLIVGALGSVLTHIITLLQVDRLDDESLLLGVAFTLPAFLLSVLLVLGGRRIYGWIYVGFHQERQATEFVQSTAAVVSPSIIGSSVPTELTVTQTPDQGLNAYPEEKKMSRNYLVRHWRGELSLPVSYWINGGVLVGIVSMALYAAVNEMGNGSYSLRAISFASIGILLFSVTAWLWSIVGIWRSADHHVARGGTYGWASAARVMVVLGFIALTGNLSTTILPQVKELALIAIGNDPLGEIVIKVSANGQSVIAIGTLREGSAAKVQKILDAAPGATTLVLNSNGGRLFEAQQLARAVRNRNLDTYVEHQCVSACTYIFLAGRDRVATPNAKIGFHQPSFPGLDADTQRFMMQDMINVYRATGLPDEFIQRIGRTSPEDMWYPTREELIDSNVITRISHRRTFLQDQ